MIRNKERLELGFQLVSRFEASVGEMYGVSSMNQCVRPIKQLETLPPPRMGCFDKQNRTFFNAKYSRRLYVYTSI